MKRSLSFTNLTGLGSNSNGGIENDNGHVRKIQSCAARFCQDGDSYSIDFFDNLLDEFENEDNNNYNNNDYNYENNNNLNNITSPNNNNNNSNSNNNNSTLSFEELSINDKNDKPKTMFTTHDLTTLLSFLTPSQLSITTISSSSTS